MKPLSRKNYGSIPHLSNSKLGSGDHFIEKGQERILTEKKRDIHDRIFVYEKYDGSNVGVAKKDGKIFALTRSGYEAKTSPYRQHHLFSDWVYSYEEMFKHLLKDGERICGEWLAQAHGLKYKIMGEPIIFFDLFEPNNKRKSIEYLDWVWNTYPKIKSPRLIHVGGPIKVADILEKLNEKTIHTEAIENPEGMVYRVERKGKVDFLAKWVRSDFEAGKYIIDKEENELIWNVKTKL